MALRREIIDFVWLRLLDDMHQTAGIRHVPIVEDEVPMGDMRILIEVIDAIGIEQGGAALDAVNLITFAQQQLREEGAILAGYTGDQCYFAHHSGPEMVLYTPGTARR